MREDIQITRPALLMPACGNEFKPALPEKI